MEKIELSEKASPDQRVSSVEGMFYYCDHIYVWLRVLCVEPVNYIHFIYSEYMGIPTQFLYK